MKKKSIVILTILLFGCYSEKNKQVSDSKPTKELPKVTIVKSEQNRLLDTLVFIKNMDRELLAEKFAFGLTELEFYKNFISNNKVGEKQILEEKNSKTEITYLGKIKDLDKENSYHVITNFKVIGIGEMLSPRGKSNLVFIDRALDEMIIYNLSLPDELPKKIENNILYFTLDNNQIGILIKGGLPPMLCLPIIGCN